MDWLSFIASVVGSLAWPGAVVCVALLLRRELKGLLPFLRKLKAGPVEAEFERELKEVNASLPSTRPRLLEGRSQLLQLAELSPRAAVLEAWRGVESASRRAALQHASGSPVPDVSSPLRAINLLAQRKLISGEEIALFHDLRGLRNQATHAPDFSPSFDSVSSYLQLAGSLQARLEQLAGGET